MLKVQIERKKGKLIVYPNKAFKIIIVLDNGINKKSCYYFITGVSNHIHYEI